MELFSQFCNVCYIDNFCTLTNICETDKEYIKDILVSLIDKTRMINNADIYLCTSCCEQLLQFKKFKEMCMQNLVEMREIFYKMKSELELETSANTKTKLKDFVYRNVYRQSVEISSNSETPDKFIGDQDHVAVAKEEEVAKSPKNSMDNGPTIGEACGSRVEKRVSSVDKWHLQLHEVKILDESGDELEGSYGDEYAAAESASETKDEISNNLTESSLKKDNCSQDKSTDANADELYKCEVCARTFTQSCSLARHKRVHSGEKPYKCGICSRTFSHSFSLLRHKRVHSGEKPYKCDVCSRTFSQNSNMRVHKLVHTSEEPLECKVCGQIFRNHVSLEYHNREHSGEKRYKCDECPRTFNDRSNLRRHKRVHSGEKPFQCELCARYFTDRTNLHLHMRLHSGEKPYKCQVCARSFTQRSSLRSHTLVHSGPQ